MKFLWVCNDYFCLINRLPLTFTLLILSGEARSQLTYEIYLNNNYTGAVAYRQETNAISQHIEYEYHLNIHVDNIADLFTGKTQEPDLNSATKTIILITIDSHSDEQYPRTQFACKKMNPDRVSSGWDSNYPIQTVTKNVIVDPIIDPVVTCTAIYPDRTYQWITGLSGNPLYAKIDTTDCCFKTWQNSDVTFPAMTEMTEMTEMTTVKFNKPTINNKPPGKPPETVSALISSGEKSLTLEYRLCPVESMAQWSRQLHSPPTPGFVTCDNPFQHNLTRPCEKCDTTQMDWESSDTKPETEVAPAGKTTGTGFQIRTVADMISPKNGQFVEDLQRNGHDIYLKLQDDIARKPKDRTVPMPGMEKVIHEINEFVAGTVLTTTSMTTGDKCIYQQLQSDLNQLKTNGCPWNQSFILTYKAAHLISFFNKDRAAHYHTPEQKEPSDDLKSPRSYYKKGATLAALNALPWQDALNAPENFLNQLRVLWHSFHLEIHPYAKRHKPLDNMSNFSFHSADELNLAFFNRTWMLGIHPFGFFTTAEIQFDGRYGLCADFMEHDILHSHGDTIINPKIYMQTQFFLDSVESSQQIKRRFFGIHPDLIKGEIDFPAQALHLLMFEIQHERARSLMLGTVHGYLGIKEKLLTKWSFSAHYDDQKKINDRPYLLAHEFIKAAIFLHCLEQSGFWTAAQITTLSFFYEDTLRLYSEFGNNIPNKAQNLKEYIHGSCFGKASIDPAIHASVLKRFFDDATVINRHSIKSIVEQLPNNYGHALKLAEDEIDFPLTALSLYLNVLMKHSVPMHALDQKYDYIKQVNTIVELYPNADNKTWGTLQMEMEFTAVFVMALTHCEFWQAKTQEEAKTKLLQSHQYYNAYLLHTLYAMSGIHSSALRYHISLGSCIPLAFDKSMHLLTSKNSLGSETDPKSFRLIRIEPRQAILLPVPVNKENWSFFPSENPQVTAFRTDDAIHLFNHRNEHKIFKGVTEHNYDDASESLTLKHVNGAVTIMLKGDNAPEVIDIQ